LSYRPDASTSSKTDYSTPPVTYHKTSDPGRARKIGGILIVVGLVLLVAGGAVAYIPMTWKSASDIVNDWEGGDVGYFRSYNEGDKATVLGEITFEIPVDVILADTLNYTAGDLDYYRDLKGQGYYYVYILDNAYEMELYSNADLGDAGDDVSLELTLRMMNLGGFDYWAWTGESIEEPNANLYYALGIPVLILGLILAAFGAKKYLEGKRVAEAEQPEAETQFDYSSRDE
jgi:hypothetical protein